MKKTIGLLLCILVSVALMSCTGLFREKSINPERTEIRFSQSKIEVDNELLYYTKEFIKDAMSYGYNIPELSKNFHGIYVGTPPPGAWGVTMYNNEGSFFVIIQPGLTENQKGVVVYHELAHYYIKGGTHCHRVCEHIMSSIGGKNNFYRDWEWQKEQLFK